MAGRWRISPWNFTVPGLGSYFSISKNNPTHSLPIQKEREKRLIRCLGIVLDIDKLLKKKLLNIILHGTRTWLFDIFEINLSYFQFELISAFFNWAWEIWHLYTDDGPNSHMLTLWINLKNENPLVSGNKGWLNNLVRSIRWDERATLFSRGRLNKRVFQRTLTNKKVFKLLH